MNKPLLMIETGGPGGAERVVFTLSQFLLARGTEVSVMTFRRGWLTHSLEERGIPHILLESRGRFDIGLPYRISRVISRGGFDILHSHLLDSNFYGAMAAKLAGVPHIATEHGDVHHTAAKRLLRTKIRTMRALGSQCTAVSSYTANKMRTLGMGSAPISVIGNPVAPINRSETERSSTRARLGIDEDPSKHWLWLHTANLRPVKDQVTLLRGFVLACRNSSRKQTLAILGDGPIKGELEQLAKNLGEESRILFLGYRDDVVPWLCGADGFILSSLSEASPMAMLEAARAGLVLIGSSAGGIPELLGDGRGYLFPPGSPDQLSEQICRTLSQPDEARERAKAAEKFVEKHHSPDKVTQQYLELYREALSKR